MAFTFRNVVGGAVAGAGKALKLPEFGISEQIQGVPSFTGGVPEAGSRPVYGPVRPAGPLRPSGQILGATPGGGKTPQASQQTRIPQDILESAPGFQEPQIDISPALEALGQAESAQQSEFESTLAGIERAKQQGVGRTESALQVKEEEFGRQKTREERIAQQRVDEQRRAFAEMSQGLGARFGAEVSTGLGAIAILGRQVMQNISQQRTFLRESMQNIDFELMRTREVGRQQIDDFQAQAEDLKAQAKAQYQQALATIAGQRAQVHTNKMAIVAEAVQNYQNVLAGIEQRNTAFRQQIFQQEQKNALAASNFAAQANRQFQTNLARMLTSFNLSEEGLRFTEQSFGAPTGTLLSSKQTGGILDINSLADQILGTGQEKQ